MQYKKLFFFKKKKTITAEAVVSGNLILLHYVKDVRHPYMHFLKKQRLYDASYYTILQNDRR